MKLKIILNDFFTLTSFWIFSTSWVLRSKKCKMRLQKKFNNKKLSFHHNISSPNIFFFLIFLIFIILRKTVWSFNTHSLFVGKVFMVPPLHQITYLARLVPVQTPKPLDILSLTLASLTQLKTSQFVNVMMNMMEPGATYVQITIMEIQKCRTGNVFLVTAMKTGSKMLKVTELCLKCIFESLVSSRMLQMIKNLS